MPHKIMRLSAFIRSHEDQITDEWESFAKTLQPAADHMTSLALRDHIKQILKFVADDLESPQTDSEQLIKSQGDGPKEGGLKDSAAETHAALRLIDGFDMDQMVSEYRALRASIVKLWRDSVEEFDKAGLDEIIRLNESIDQAMTESIHRYSQKLNHSKDIFLSILGHDLRNPLGAIIGSAELIARIGNLNERQAMLIAQVTESAFRTNDIINNLLDVTRTQLGSGLPIVRDTMDFGILAHKMVKEMRAANERREIILNISGDLVGEWDESRIGQVFSNLIGNSVQYGFQDSAIMVTVTGESKDVILTVHNFGPPISISKIGRIFDSLVRGVPEGANLYSANLGLGLYITKEIVTAHGGEISVTSSQDSGTAFSAQFPRNNKL